MSICTSSHIFHHISLRLILAWAIAGLCVLASHVVTYRHISQLKQQISGNKRRDLVVRLLRLGSVLGLAFWLLMVFPRNSAFLHVVVSMRLSISMHLLSELFMNFLAGENEHDHRATNHRVVALLSHLPPRRFLLVAPIGHILCACVPASTFSASHLRLVNLCARQFVFIPPLLAILSLNVHLQGNPPSAFTVSVNVVTILSSLSAVWSINVLQSAMGVLIPEYDTLKKARALQLIFLVTSISSLAIPFIVKRLHRIFDSSYLNIDTIEVEVMGFYGCVISLLFSILLVRVFTSHDLTTIVSNNTIETRAQECHGIIKHSSTATAATVSTATADDLENFLPVTDSDTTTVVIANLDRSFLNRSSISAHQRPNPTTTVVGKGTGTDTAGHVYPEPLCESRPEGGVTDQTPLKSGMGAHWPSYN